MYSIFLVAKKELKSRDKKEWFESFILSGWAKGLLQQAEVLPVEE